MYVPFADYAPDSAALNSNASDFVENVVPDNGYYAPVHSRLPFGKKLDGAVSLWWTITLTGEPFMIAGTRTKLYRFINGVWSDISKDGSYAINPEYGWNFVNFAQRIIAVAPGTPPQIYDERTNLFRDIENNYTPPNPATPNAPFTPQNVPQTFFVGSTPEFLFLIGDIEKPSRLWWSGIRDPESWESGQNTSSFNDFDQGGAVRAISSGTSPIVLLERAIYVMNRVDVEGGFSIEKLATDIGAFFVNSSAVLGTRIYFVDESGFCFADEATRQITNIGLNRVNQYVKRHFSRDRTKFSVKAYSDPRARRIYWAFSDETLVYDELRDKWGRIGKGAVSGCIGYVNADMLTQIKQGWDGSQNVYPVDSTHWEFKRTAIAEIGDDSQIYIRLGKNAEAIVKTPPVGSTNNQMVNLNNVNAVVDSEGYDLLLKIEQNNQWKNPDAPVINWLTQSRIDGLFRTRSRFRTAKFTLKIPENVDWSMAQGIDYQIIPGGVR